MSTPGSGGFYNSLAISIVKRFAGLADSLAARGASKICIRARLHRLRKKSGFVSGYRFSDTVSPSKSDAPLGAGQGKFTFSAASSAVPQVH
jgi:hypothetical protein